MKFHEVAVNEKFKYNNLIYVKTPEERVSCCKIKSNCQNIYTKEKNKLNPMDEVDKLQTN